MEIEEIKQKYCADTPFFSLEKFNEELKNSKTPAANRTRTEYEKAKKEILLAKQMRQAERLDLAQAISNIKEHSNLQPVRTVLNGIDNAREKLRAMVKKIEEKYLVNVGSVNLN